MSPSQSWEHEMATVTGYRRRARTIALQVLYEIDSVGHPAESTLERHLAEAGPATDTNQYARRLVEGVLGRKNEIDQRIAAAAPAWPLDQMAKIDKNVLRLAIFEILFNNTVPLKAAVNEAVELAKTFGSENSAKFVNGVLGSIIQQLDRQ